jgi:hypothetical protein
MDIHGKGRVIKRSVPDEQSRIRLHEKNRGGGYGIVELPDVVNIISPDANDFHDRFRNRSE